MLATYQIDTFTIIGVIAITTLIVLVSLNAFLRNQKSRPFDRQAIDPSFVLQLKNAFGFANLLSVSVEHERIKFTVENVKLVNFEQLKSLSNTGVFVKGKSITMTLDYEPKIIKKLIEKGE